MSSFGLISWEYCKTLLDMDERDKAIVELLIFSASAQIELFIDRNLFEREIREIHDGYMQKEITLTQYPVKEILKLYYDKKRAYTETTLVAPEYYTCTLPEAGGNGEIPSDIILCEGYRFPKGRNTIQVLYRAGYGIDEMPENIKTATLELVDWSLKRTRSGQIGASGLVRENNTKPRSMFELTMPVHVRDLLEPFKRKRW